MSSPKTVICEDSGKVSSMRIAMLGIVFVVVLTWLAFCIVAGELVDIPEGPRWIAIAAMGWKAGQKIGEVAKDRITFK